MNVNKATKKIPFNGKGKNLIDFFCIIGHEEHFVEEAIVVNYPKRLSYHPTILSSICSEEADPVFDETKLMKIIYPALPEVTENTSVKDKETNIIFAFPISNAKGTSQNVVCGFSKRFYEPYYSHYLKRTIYLPKALSIISKFPYFTTFNSICSHILLYYQHPRIANKYPIELVLYLIINYTPSPLNSEVILDLFPCRDVNELQISLRLPQLSGYPVIDFNLSALFNLLPLYFVIEVFIFTLLEIDIFFFSENLEILNIVMYIFYALNYPLNDSMNFWHIFSLSKKDLTEKSKPQFINSILSKCIIFLGVNCKYEDSIEMPKQFNNFSIIDLDSKKIIHKGDEKNVNDRNQIGKYIQRCGKGKVSSQFMQNLILNLINNINSINIEQSRMSLAFTIQKPLKFFEFNNEINDNNRKIQESFYEVIIGLLKKFYKDHKISFDTNDKTNNDHKIEIGLSNQMSNNKYELFKLDYDPDNASCDKAELLIIDLFKSSTKFDNYFKNYLYDFSSQDNYLVPLMFSEEFINLNLSSTTKINNDSSNKFYFDVIDNFYYNSDDNFTTLNMSQNKISFDSFVKTAKAELTFQTITIGSEPKIVAKKSLRTSISLLPIQPEVQAYSFFKVIKLSKKALLKTIEFCTNLEENIKHKLLPPEKIIISNSLTESLSLRLVHSVEEAMISLNLVHVDNILLSSLFSLFLVSNLEISFYDSMVFFNHLTFQLISRQYFIRKYIHYLLLSFYSLITSEKFDSKNMYITQRIKMYYTLILSISNNNQVFPNEELTQLMLNLKNNNHMKTPSQITIDELISKEKENDIGFSIAIIGKDNKEIKSKIILQAIKDSLCSCNVEVNKTERDSKRDEAKIKFEFKNLEEVSKIVNKHINQYNKLPHLYSPVKLKEKCEEICNQYMENGCIYKDVIDKVTDFDSIIINIIYYSTTSIDLKFFTHYFIKIFILHLNGLN